MTVDVKHPAQYTPAVLEAFQTALRGVSGKVLDPFAGMGNIHSLQTDTLTTFGIEIEPEWAGQHPRTILGSALTLPFANNSFDAVATSPVYGNRMSDSHNAQERCKACAEQGCDKCDWSGKRSYKRMTYTHTLGRVLHDDNAGVLQWGPRYKEFHREAWAETIRVLKPGGLFVLNCSDHIRRGKIMPVTAWHVSHLTTMGIEWGYRVEVPTPRMRYGQNAHLRVGHEDVFVGRLLD